MKYVRHKGMLTDAQELSSPLRVSGKLKKSVVTKCMKCQCKYENDRNDHKFGVCGSCKNRRGTYSNDPQFEGA